MRIFTDEELLEEARPLSEKALEALEKGQIERLHYLLNEMDAGHKELCGLGLHWLPRMWSKIRINMGEAVLARMLSEMASYLMEPYVDEFLRGSEKTFICEIVQIWRCQYGGNLVPVAETAEDVVFALSPCGSGGRLVLEGWPQALPEFYAPCSDGTPIYCRGCKALQEAFNQACGAPIWTTQIRSDLPGACEMRFLKGATRGQKLFEPAELYRLVQSNCRQALEKILMGDLNIADLIRDQHREWRPYHDLMVEYAVCTQSLVYREKGAEYLDGFLKETYDSAFKMFYPIYDMLDDVSLLRLFVRVWHYHQATFRVQEEENRFAFILDPCGSGGRMYRAEMHKGQFRYGEGIPCLMKEPANINFNRKDFPIYCTHCASSNRDQFEGNPFIFVIDGHSQKDPGSPCIEYLYKKAAPREVSPGMLAQVGLKAVRPRP